MLAKTQSSYVPGILRLENLIGSTDKWFSVSVFNNHGLIDSTSIFSPNIYFGKFVKPPQSYLGSLLLDHCKIISGLYSSLIQYILTRSNGDHKMGGGESIVKWVCFKALRITSTAYPLSIPKLYLSLKGFFAFLYLKAPVETSTWKLRLCF